MLPAFCPEFEYDNHPHRARILGECNNELFHQIEAGQLDPKHSTTDTRPIHYFLFAQLCPTGFEYYAGNYRGADKICLRNYNVEIWEDPRVGYRAPLVSGAMAELASSIREGLDDLDRQFREHTGLSMEDKRLLAIAFACRIFVDFLTIHPYANGNGHAARFCLISILFRYGILLRGWRIEPRPGDPHYSDRIKRYRDGDHTQFEEFVVRNSVTFDPPLA